MGHIGRAHATHRGPVVSHRFGRADKGSIHNTLIKRDDHHSCQGAAPAAISHTDHLAIES